MQIQLATISQVTPLRVTLDGATSDSDATQITVFTAVLGQRVAVVPNGSSILVIGPYGG